MSLTTIFILTILLLGFLITFQIAKASEYVGILKGEKKTLEQNNRINAFLLILFLVGGLLAVYWCHELFKGRTLGEAASDHGQKIDKMLHLTIYITGAVFVLTQCCYSGLLSNTSIPRKEKRTTTRTITGSK